MSRVYAIYWSLMVISLTVIPPSRSGVSALPVLQPRGLWLGGLLEVVRTAVAVLACCGSGFGVLLPEAAMCLGIFCRNVIGVSPC